MFSKVSVLVPTRHRTHRLDTMIASYESTTQGASELVFRVDDDDLTTQDYLLRHCNHRIVVGPRLGGYQSMPTFFNEMAAKASGDVLMCGNDDMVFQSMDWDARILEAANCFPDGVFDLGVSTHNETHYPFSIVSKKLVEHLGFLWDPTVFWGDIFLRDAMAWYGRCVMIPHVKIDHDWAGNDPDQVFHESDKNITMRDPTYWTGTHYRAVHNAIDKLKDLFDPKFSQAGVL